MYVDARNVFSRRCSLAKASKNRIGIIVSSVILSSLLFVKFVKELGLTIKIKSNNSIRYLETLREFLPKSHQILVCCQKLWSLRDVGTSRGSCAPGPRGPRATCWLGWRRGWGWLGRGRDRGSGTSSWRGCWLEECRAWSEEREDYTAAGESRRGFIWRARPWSRH